MTHADSRTPMTVVQCWDDGVTDDVPLLEILRRHGARASFNLNAGNHKPERQEAAWERNGHPVGKLGLNELCDVYEGFTIANHGFKHLSLAKVSIDDARRDVVDGRDRLQQLFGQPILGFAYACGSYNAEVMDVLREAGHVYARTTQTAALPVPPDYPMAFHPCCHFLAPDFWDRYETAREGGVFYFWGHSYEMIDEAMWSAFDEKIQRISADPDARWGELPELFATEN